jgi:hypothetical protein
MASKITPIDDLPPIAEEAEYAPPPPPPPPPQYAPQYQQQQQQQYAEPAAAPKDDPPSLWQTVMQLSMSPVFLKALAVTFVIAFVALSFPVEDYVLKHVSFAESVPNAGLVVKALVISVASTFWRPPCVQ